MSEIETFDAAEQSRSPLRNKQREGVAKMTTSLLACCDDNLAASRHAINQITSMRIYHQLARIIRYTEMCDKIEDKLYESLDYTLASADLTQSSTWMVLLSTQERLQKLMVESHKLLQPYLDLQEFGIVDLVNSTAQGTESSVSSLDAAARERIRNAAQYVLAAIDNPQPDSKSNDSDNSVVELDAKSDAANVLASLEGGSDDTST